MKRNKLTALLSVVMALARKPLTMRLVSLALASAVASLTVGSLTVRADVIVQTEGTPAPFLSPILAHDVNFDDVPTGTLITPTLFASEGLASITNVGLPLFTFPSTESVPNYVGTGPNDGWAMNMTIVFGALQSVVGFGDAGPNTTTLSAFDASGGLLYTKTFLSATNDYWVLTDTTGANIDAIEIQSSFIAVDDVQFNNAVPEPSTLMLLGSGLLLFARKLRKAA